MSIRESALSLINSISQSDYLRAVTSGGDSRRVTMANAAKAVVEGYSGSSLGGSQQTVKAAIDAISAMANDIDKIAIKNTASGAVASFSDGSDGLPIQSLIADINAVQSGSGDPSPTNIRPISGHTEVDVVRTGKNLIPNSATTETKNGLTFTVNSDGSVKVTGTASADTVCYMVASASRALDAYLIDGQSYTLTGCPNGGGNSTYSLQIMYGGSAWQSDNGSGKTFTYSSLSGNALCRIFIKSGQALGTNGITFYPMVRFSSVTDTTYEPYTGQSYTTALGRTVYGGTLDLISGVLTVTKAYLSLTADYWAVFNTSFKTAFTNGSYMGCTITNCDSLAPEVGLSSTAGYIGIRIADGRIGATPQWAQSITSLNDFKTALANNPPINVVYELATPQTYQLTPQQIQTVLGQNNVWADSGDVEVVYIADTKLYVDNH